MAAATLFIGPYYGEFGHELGFAAMARTKAEGYGRVIVSTRAARHALYADFATEFRPHGIKCEGMCAHGTHETQPPQSIVERWMPHEREVDMMNPVLFNTKLPHRYARYGHARPEWSEAIVFHARSRPHVKMRNWPQANWHRLARRIMANGLAKRVVTIGLPGAALAAEGAADMRGHDLATQMDVMASAKMIVGPSSGPMHLATLCCGERRHANGKPQGCPQLVWCGGPGSEPRITSGRYTHTWNPFNTPTDSFRCGSWQPSLEAVWERLVAFHARLEAVA